MVRVNEPRAHACVWEYYYMHSRVIDKCICKKCIRLVTPECREKKERKKNVFMWGGDDDSDNPSPWDTHTHTHTH